MTSHSTHSEAELLTKRDMAATTLVKHAMMFRAASGETEPIMRRDDMATNREWARRDVPLDTQPVTQRDIAAVNRE